MSLQVNKERDIGIMRGLLKECVPDYSSEIQKVQSRFNLSFAAVHQVIFQSTFLACSVNVP
jgi:hypothetical protein